MQFVELGPQVQDHPGLAARPDLGPARFLPPGPGRVRSFVAYHAGSPSVTTWARGERAGVPMVPLSTVDGATRACTCTCTGNRTRGGTCGHASGCTCNGRAAVAGSCAAGVCECIRPGQGTCVRLSGRVHVPLGRAAAQPGARA